MQFWGELVNVSTVGLDDVVVQYRSGWQLGPVSVSFPIGVSALIGPNGAGKTTMFGVLTGITTPKLGTLRRNDQVIARSGEYSRYRSHVGYVPQECSWSPSWPVEDFLAFCARMYRVSFKQVGHRCRDVMSDLNIDEFAHQPIGTLSGGQKRRVFLAAALVHDPEVLILDEPTVGLDPGERIAFRCHVVEQAASRVVVLSTHLMDDVALASDQVHLVGAGRITWSGSLSGLMAAAGEPEADDHLSTAERAYLRLTQEHGAQVRQSSLAGKPTHDRDPR